MGIGSSEVISDRLLKEESSGQEEPGTHRSTGDMRRRKAEVKQGNNLLGNQGRVFQGGGSVLHSNGELMPKKGHWIWQVGGHVLPSGGQFLLGGRERSKGQEWQRGKKLH